MKGHSIRLRLTAWYTALMTLVLVVAGAGAWWLLERGVQLAADRRLDTHFDGVRRFIEGLEPNLTVEDVSDEFREYADLSPGDALLQVTDASGVVLCKPKQADWRLAVAALGPDTAGTARISINAQMGGRPFRLARGPVTAAGRTFTAIIAAPVGPAADALVQARTWLLWLLPASVVVAATIGYVVSGRALAPVDRMVRAAQAITLESLDRRIELPGADDELRRLATTFNEMLERLQASVSDIVRFTADASHELRTPVSIVRTTAEIALARERSTDDYRQALTEVLQQAERMSGTVADLLALARADAGVEPRAADVVDLARVVRDVCAEMRPFAARQGVELRVHAPCSPVSMMGDADSLRRLAASLLDNALKYTPAGGAVDVRVDRETTGSGPSTVVLDVSDEGIGIDPGDLPHVFDRFFRGTGARARAADGSGLGLAIARGIVVRHGGTIAIEPAPSTRERRAGCRVVVRFREPLGH
jgi:heavy metal sensor kinase